MPRTIITVALACLALAAVPLHAQAPEAIDSARAVAELAALTGTEYVAARDALLGQLATAAASAQYLEELATADRWTADRWRAAAAAGALEVRLRKPELAGQIDHLRGVDPAHYTLRRVPSPEVGRELAHLGATTERSDVVTLVIETYAFLRDVYPTSERGRDAERAALSEGLLVALERLADSRGLPLAREVAVDEDATIPDRVAATIGTGAMAGRALASAPDRDVSAQIALLVGQSAGPVRLRHAAAQALARIPNAASLAALEDMLDRETDQEVRATILTSMGLFAAPMVWHSYGAALAPSGDALRARAAGDLAGHFATTDSAAERTAAHNGVLMARHEAALEHLDAEVPEQAHLIAELNASIARSRR